MQAIICRPLVLYRWMCISSHDCLHGIVNSFSRKFWRFGGLPSEPEVLLYLFIPPEYACDDPVPNHQIWIHHRGGTKSLIFRTTLHISSSPHHCEHVPIYNCSCCVETSSNVGSFHRYSHHIVLELGSRGITLGNRDWSLLRSQWVKVMIQHFKIRYLILSCLHVLWICLQWPLGAQSPNSISGYTVIKYQYFTCHPHSSTNDLLSISPINPWPS